jgi:hypothetical protein
MDIEQPDEHGDELRGRLRAYLVGANRDLVHVVESTESAHSCACGFTTDDPEVIGRHLAEARSPEARARVLRRLLRGRIADELMRDLDGGESLTKEVWEACQDAQEDLAVRDELRVVLSGVLGEDGVARVDGQWSLERECCGLMMETCEGVAVMLVGLGKVAGESSSRMFDDAASSLRALLRTMSARLGQ